MYADVFLDLLVSKDVLSKKW